MSEPLFQSIYADHYARPSRAFYWVPLALIITFASILSVLAFVKTDKVVDTTGLIMPKKTYVSRLSQRGFLLENRTVVGRSMKKGDILATVQQDDGSLKTFTAQHDGTVVQSPLRNSIDGPMADGVLIAAIVDPRELVLKVELPAPLRGIIKAGSRVRYKFNTFTRAVSSHVLDHDIRLSGRDNGDGNGNDNNAVTEREQEGQVEYAVYAQLEPAHQQISYLGKQLPVKLLVEDVSLIDYFLNF